MGSYKTLILPNNSGRYVKDYFEYNGPVYIISYRKGYVTGLNKLEDSNDVFSSAAGIT